MDTSLVLWAASVTLLATVIIARTWGMKRSSGQRGHRLPAGSRGWPLVGETLQFVSCAYSPRPERFMDKRTLMYVTRTRHLNSSPCLRPPRCRHTVAATPHRYGKVFRSHLFGSPTIVSTDAEVSRCILQSDARTFVPWYPKSLTELMGKSSILLINGNLQRRVHGLIGAFFKSSDLKAQITRDMQSYVRGSMINWQDDKLIRIQDETKKVCVCSLQPLLIPPLLFSSLHYYFPRTHTCTPVAPHARPKKNGHTTVGEFNKPELGLCMVYAVEHHHLLLLVDQIIFQILVKGLIGLEPGKEMQLLKQQFKEFIAGLMSLPVKLPGSRLYRSLQASLPPIHSVDSFHGTARPINERCAVAGKEEDGDADKEHHRGEEEEQVGMRAAGCGGCADQRRQRPIDGQSDIGQHDRSDDTGGGFRACSRYTSSQVPQRVSSCSPTSGGTHAH
ncbi:hypothetical protein BHM03_00005284 [Ensete ventricosum]|nr:hypothetical protein BHM03_00005284 [Ensete ventricosum]